MALTLEPATAPAVATGTLDPNELAAPPGPARLAGVAALIAVALCAVGAIFNQAVPSADIYRAMEEASGSELGELLAELAADQTPIVIGFSVWLVAFPLTALASILLIRLGRPSAVGDAVRHLTAGMIGTTTVFLSMFIAYVVTIAPAHVAGDDVLELARAVGYAATTADWVLTAVFLGIAPITAVVLGRDIWAPRWLQIGAAVVAAVTVLELIALGADTRALALPLVPAGLALIAAAGVCALRYEPGVRP